MMSTIKELSDKISNLEKKGSIEFQNREDLNENLSSLQDQIDFQINRLSEIESSILPPELVGEIYAGPDPDGQSNKPVFPLFTVEQNGKLVGNRMNFSFGNGNEHSGLDAGGWGFIAPFDLSIKILTVGSRVAADSNGNEITVVLNENPTKSKSFVETDTKIGLAKGQRNLVKDVDLFVKSGTVINLLTTNPGGDDLVVTAWASV